METRSGNSGYGGVTREQEADRRMVRKRYNDLKQRVKSSTTDLTDVIKEADELLDVAQGNSDLKSLKEDLVVSQVTWHYFESHEGKNFPSSD